jgi:hypothetical protein
VVLYGGGEGSTLATCSLFSTTMELTNSFPPVDALVEFSNKKLKEFDYVQFGEDVIKFSATATAVVIGVVSYVWTALQLWWEDNGETTQVNFIRFLVNVIDFIGAIAYATPKVYRWVQLNTNRLIDSVYFQYTFA